MKFSNLLIKTFFLLILNLVGVLSIQAQFNGDFEIKRYYLGEENFYDWKAYQTPVNWDKNWLSTKNGMKSSTGSISMEEFYIFHEIKLQMDMSDYISFLYKQQQNSFFRPEDTYQEAEFRFGKSLYYSIIGFPTYEKKYGSFGHALSIGESENFNFIKISKLDQYIVYNEKNVENDAQSTNNRYRTTPVLYRLQSNYLLSESWFINVDLKHETKTIFNDFDQQQESQYQGAERHLQLEWQYGLNSIAGIKMNQDTEKRQIIPESKAVDIDSDQILMLESYDLYIGYPVFDKDYLSMGLMRGRFQNIINNLNDQKTYDFLLESDQIYSKWQWYLNDHSNALYALQAGSFHLYKKQDRIIELDDNGIQIKATIGLIYHEKDKYQLVLNSTWDLDLIQDRQWDGGNVLFIFYF